MMKTKISLGLLVVLMLTLTACKSHYQLTGIERTRILVDSRYDANPDPQALAFIAPYKHTVDSMMSPVLGKATRYLVKGRPESGLSNLLTDILVWGGERFNEHPDFAVYNIGGMRAAIAEGNITYGDVIEVAPFENKICFLTLKGDKVIELFQQIAHRMGEGVSHGVELIISPDGRLLSACLNGQEIDPQKEYRLATLDYLSQGNDGMTAFKAGTDVLSPQSEENNVRFIIMDYIRQQTALGKAIDGQTEGRIVIK